MTSPEIETLEREVELSRGRLVTDLARVRAAADFSALKDDLLDEARRKKDEIVGSAKDAAQSRAEGVLSEIKARIAANPGAALAIGAGVAWRLYKRPPIATLLVGAGLASLLRTDPQHPAVGADFAARAVDFAGTAKQRVDEFRAGDPAGQARQFARTATEQAGEFVETARERVGELAASATERVSELAETAREQVGDAADATRRRAAAWRPRSGRGAPPPVPYSPAGRRSRRIGRPVRDFVPSPETRDQVLLGAASLAIAAAVGIAWQRRDGAH